MDSQQQAVNSGQTPNNKSSKLQQDSEKQQPT